MLIITTAESQNAKEQFMKKLLIALFSLSLLLVFRQVMAAGSELDNAIIKL